MLTFYKLSWFSATLYKLSCTKLHYFLYKKHSYEKAFTELHFRPFCPDKRHSFLETFLNARRHIFCEIDLRFFFLFTPKSSFLHEEVYGYKGIKEVFSYLVNIFAGQTNSSHFLLILVALGGRNLRVETVIKLEW